MAKRKNDWNESIFEKRIREKRGLGDGVEYKSWVSAQDFSSNGSTYRIKGVKIPRQYVLFSKTMYFIFLYLEYCDYVIDIKENFPIHDIYNDENIVSGINLRKFRDKKSGLFYTQMVSFMIKALDEDGMEYEFACAVLNSSSLNKKITLESLEMKRRYYETRDIEFHVITNKDIDRNVIRNLELFREGAELIYDTSISEMEMKEFRDVLLERVRSTDDSILQVIKGFQLDFETDRGLTMNLLKNLFWTKKLFWKLKEPFDINISCESVTV